MAAAIVGRRAARNFGGAWDLYFNVSSLSRNIKEMSSDQKTQNSRSAGSFALHRGKMRPTADMTPFAIVFLCTG